MKEIVIQTSSRDEMKDITNMIETNTNPDHTGIVIIYVPHTTAGICVNEGADPDVKKDVIMQLNEIIRWDHPQFYHSEGNSAAHIKSILIGNSKQIIVEKGKLMLGTWEHIFLCEFDGPRKRKIWLQFV